MYQTVKKSKVRERDMIIKRERLRRKLFVSLFIEDTEDSTRLSTYIKTSASEEKFQY